MTKPARARRSRPRPSSPTPADADRLRWSKIVTAQRRIASDYYDRDEVQRAVVRAVLAELHRS
jgi:hypothetical protein